MTQDSRHEKRNDIHLSQLASVGQVAAGIAHEVKNPLTAVKGFLQLLREKNDQQYIEIAESELDNALSILQNLLQVSKPDLDDESLSTVDLTVELESIIQLFQDQFYRINVITDFLNPGIPILGKKNQLKKTFFNLIKNAFEAIPDKGTIRIGQRASEDEVIVYIQDSGMGIPSHKLDLLGTPFFTTKESGTGMGLTLVYTVIYQHNGTIDVQSKEQAGTTFTISFPRLAERDAAKEVKMLELNASVSLEEFFRLNRDTFEKRLLAEAVNVRDKIDEILTVGNINLLDNAHKLVLFIVEGKEHEVIFFAKNEGINWAKHSLTLAFKLEWIQALRRVMWDFLYNFDRMNDYTNSREDFYLLEKRINELMDLFLNNLFISYNQYKDELIQSQRELVEGLSVPIIPLTESVSILPLIGSIDAARAEAIEDKVISQIGQNRIDRLIIDLSGVLRIEPGVLQHLINAIKGIEMMGCKAVITGLSADIVKIMLKSGLAFESKVTMKGTLQQALENYLPQLAGDSSLRQQDS